jgi:hypothetical protein
MSRATRAISSALPQLLRLMIEIASGARCPPRTCGRHACRLQAERDLGFHIGQLELDELGGRERPAELGTIERILPRGVHAGLGRAHRAPGDAVARAVEAAERTP